MQKKMDKTGYAYNYIKRMIIDGTLEPLSDISEIELQNKLGISRTPIREALQRLEKEWFVYIYPRKGTIVSEITFELINSIYEVRLLNEPYLAAQYCEKADRNWLNDMKYKFLNPPKETNNEEIRSYFIGLDRELHKEMVRYSSNVFLKDILKIVEAHNQRIRIKTSFKNQDYEKAIKDHLEIIEALLENDPIKVQEVTKKHLESSKKDAFKYLSIQN